MADQASTRLRQHRGRWERKPVLRAVYEDFFDRIRARLRPGRTLEIGAGTGHFRRAGDDMVSLDIQAAPWLDLVADAHRLPLAGASFDNIVLLDTLHHLERPLVFLEEARRVLRPGGRLVLLEPGITPLSHLLYATLHEEPVRLRDDVLSRAPRDPQRGPYEANQAIPTLLFTRQRRRLAAELPGLRVTELRRLSLFAYALSGGFHRWQLIPAAAVRPLLAVEEALMPWLGRWMAMRLLVVLERDQSDLQSDLNAGSSTGTGGPT